MGKNRRKGLANITVPIITVSKNNKDIMNGLWISNSWVHCLSNANLSVIGPKSHVIYYIILSYPLLYTGWTGRMSRCSLNVYTNHITQNSEAVSWTCNGNANAISHNTINLCVHRYFFRTHSPIFQNALVTATNVVSFMNFINDVVTVIHTLKSLYTTLGSTNTLSILNMKAIQKDIVSRK